MSKMQKEIEKTLNNNVELIESKRYNSEDPSVTIEKSDDIQTIITKILTSERTGAPLRIGAEILNPAEDLALRNFSRGVRSVNTWQFKNALTYFNEAANLARNTALQQRINLYKQLNKLLEAIIQTDSDRILKSKGSFFDDVMDSIMKYDKLTHLEQQHYRLAVDALYGIACQLVEGNIKVKTQQLLARCVISLSNREYLAAYIWLYKIYLLNKDEFDKVAASDEILKTALTTLKLYLEIETELREIAEDLPTMASAYDLQTIFSDHLSLIYDIYFLDETNSNFSFQLYRENQ